MKKRLLAMLLATALLCALLPTAAMAVTVTEVVPCKYDYVGDFSEGLAWVKLNGKYGYIDKMGKEVAPCKYDYADNFSEGLARVRLDGKYGFIDTTGKEVVPCKYDWVEDFSEGLAKVGVNTGEENQHGWAIYKYGFIDTMGKEVVPCKYSWAEDFDQGLALVELSGYIDKTGKEVVPIGKYSYVGYFSEGFAAVMDENGMIGYIDATGKEVIPCKYDSDAKEISAFHDGVVVASQDKEICVIDATGKEIVPLGKYDWVDDFSEGLASVLIGDWETGKWGFIDTTGKEVIPCKYDYVERFSEGLAKVWLNFKWGVIAITEANLAYPSTQEVEVDGEKIEFQCYALKDANGYDTNYIKLRDLADILNGSAAQFQVDWDGNITITTKTAYTRNGSEQSTPFSGERPYEKTAVKTLVDGKEAELDTFQLKDDNGGGYTYYKLRDLGKALGITVDWTAQRGIFIETK